MTSRSARRAGSPPPPGGIDPWAHVPEGEGSTKAFADAAIADLRARGFPLAQMLRFVSDILRIQVKRAKEPASRLQALSRVLAGVFASLVLLFLPAADYLPTHAVVGTAIAMASWFLLFGVLAYVSLPLVRTPEKKPLPGYTIANVLTLWRLASVPMVISLILYAELLRPIGVFVFVFYTVSVLTDFLDGLIARRTGTVTDWGRAVDPLADVLVELAVVVALMLAGYVPWWFFGAVLIRYALPPVGATLLLFLRGPFEVRPTIAGKASGFLVSWVAGWVVLRETIRPSWTLNPWVNYLLFLAAVAACSWSVGNHIKLGVEALQRRRPAGEPAPPR